MFFLMFALILFIATIFISWQYFRIPDTKTIEKIFSASTIHCLEISSYFNKKRIKFVNSASPNQAADPSGTKKHIIEVRSELVGIFYNDFITEKQPFVKTGKRISHGDILCVILINCLHIANRVKSEATGTVVEINLEDGQPVEYGQLLMKIEIE